MFGLRLPRLSRTEQAIVALVRAAGSEGIELERLPALLYMADVHARQYLGHPITDIEWQPDMLLVGALQ